MLKIKINIQNKELNPITFSDRLKFDEFINKNSKQGKVFVLEIYEADKFKSEAQDKLYKKIILEGMKVTGDTFSEFENNLINSFSTIRYSKDLLGKKISQRVPYEEMTMEEARRYLELCVFHMNEFLDIKF